VLAEHVHRIAEAGRLRVGATLGEWLDRIAHPTDP
jgi:hypothetical protein